MIPLVRGVALFALLLVPLSTISFLPDARADGELRVSVREVDSNDRGAVQLLAKVVGQNGRPIPNLGTDNFSLRVGDEEIPISDVQTVIDAQVGISSLLVIDTSGSMEGTPIAAARDAAAQYVRSLDPVDEVGVLAFANGTSVISEFTSDFAAVEMRLQNLNALGNTALYDAVADAADRMNTRENARRVVILLSDGEHFGPVTTLREQALNAARDSGVPYYVIGLGPSIDVPFLQSLADSTAGAFFAAPSSDQLAALFDEIASLLRSEYIVTVDFSATDIVGDTTGVFRAEAEPGNGEVSLAFSLPELSATTVPPTSLPGIPEPVQPTVEEPSGGGSAGTVIVVLLILAAIAGGAWIVWQRIRRRRSHDLDSLPPLYGPPVEREPNARTEAAPPAVLKLDSGEEFQIAGAASLGVDDESTFQLPLTKGQFGHGELRIWFANRRYVIHDVALRPRIRVNGRPVTWSFLGDGDEIDVRGIKLRFNLTPNPEPVHSDS